MNNVWYWNWPTLLNNVFPCSFIPTRYLPLIPIFQDIYLHSDGVGYLILQSNKYENYVVTGNQTYMFLNFWQYSFLNICWFFKMGDKLKGFNPLLRPTPILYDEGELGMLFLLFFLTRQPEASKTTVKTSASWP